MCMFVWTFFLLCRLSASCHSWTTHGHICQCHEVEPFPARAGNLFHFPWVFLAPFSFLFSFFSVESLWKCATPKNAITFFFFFPRGYYWGVGGSTLIWMFVLSFFLFFSFFYRNWSWIASCFTLTDPICAGSRTCDTPWPTALRLLSVRFPTRLRLKAGMTVLLESTKKKKGKKKKELHFEWTKYVNLFPKRIDLHILKTNAVSPLLQTQHRN